MNQEVSKINSFTDLVCWQKGHALVIAVYKTTKKFPNDELFGLSNQLRRASVSITSNIAEGFSRYSYKDKTRFYYQALGSLTEVQNQLLVAKDVGYIEMSNFKSLAEATILVSKLTNGLIKKSKLNS